MSNIHGFKDYNSRQAAYQVNANYGVGTNVQPKETGCWAGFKRVMRFIFPNSGFCTITFPLMIILFIIYIASVIYAASVKNRMNSSCALYNMGAKWAPIIKYKYHFHRLFAPFFLHANFYHIFSNLLSLAFIGFTCEVLLFKRWLYIIILIIGTWGSFSFSCVCTPYTLSVGASGAILSLMGFMIVHIFANWNALTRNRKMYGAFAVFIIIYIVLNCVVLPQEGVDYCGHLGGLITGLFMAPLFYRAENETASLRLRKMRIYALILLIAFIAAFMVALMVNKYPKCGDDHCTHICPS